MSQLKSYIVNVSIDFRWSLSVFLIIRALSLYARSDRWGFSNKKAPAKIAGAFLFYSRSLSLLKAL